MRTDKPMGLLSLPSQDRRVNQGWMPRAGLAHDLACRVRLLAPHDQADLAEAQPAGT